MSCSESLPPPVSRVRARDVGGAVGVAVGVATGGEGDLVTHDGCCWVESVGVAFLCANPSLMKRDTAFWSDDIM